MNTFGRLFVFVMAMILALSASAEKVYRLVDAQGKVSYTNQDPKLMKNAPQGMPEEIEVKEAYVNKIAITQIGSIYYCGSIPLPARENIKRESFYSEVVNHNKSWKYELRSLERDMTQQRDRYSSTSTVTVENIKRHAEYRCAVDWVKKQKLQADDEKNQLIKKVNGLSVYLKELRGAQTDVCGQEPIYSLEDRRYDDRKHTWNACMSGYREKIVAIEDDLRDSDRLLLDIKLIEDDHE